MITKTPEIIKRIINIFNNREKRKFSWLFVAILILGFFEVAGVASILPFMELIAKPDAIEQSRWLTAAYEFFAFESHREMLIYFGIAIVALIAVTNLFAIYTVWLQYKYAWNTSHNLSIRLLKTYIRKPYNFFLNNNSSEMITYTISEVNVLTSGIIIPIIEMFSRSIVSVVIFALLIIVDPKIAIIMFVGLGGAYSLIYLAQKNMLKKIGKYRIKMNLGRYKSLQELFNGIKTISVYNKRPFFFERYAHNSKEFCDVQPKFNLMLSAPRYLLELLAFGSILSVTIYLFVFSGNIQTALPRLSLYAVAGYRLLPALQKLFAAASKLKHNLPVLDKLHDDLVYSLKNENTNLEAKTSLDFNFNIALDELTFQYENSEQKVINQLSVDIKKGQTIAFIGSTGSGKTTLVDLIVGLLEPTAGSLKIDGKKLAQEHIATWRDQLAYVPQEVFLFDDTILRNITLDEPEQLIDYDRLEKVMRMADIYDLVMNQLSDGHQTEIGERGVRLSGGQRQRLGLARALYKNPKILILDEATSALDSITEQGIIEALQALPDTLTTIIIAHRLSTVKHADCIYLLDKGKIASQGKYQTLMEMDDTFKTMVKLS